MLRRVGDVTFTVSDLERAVDFYENVLGLPKQVQSSTCARLDCGGVELRLQAGARADGGQEGAPSLNFLVQDVDEAYQTLRQRGVRFLEAPLNTDSGERIALFSDPDGNVLQLVQIGCRRYFAEVWPGADDDTCAPE
jgi:catechol 2,3-dioxygenase-like lactoylglutathione lyase family enzyme